MLRIVQCKSAEHAERYYTESFAREDYYLDGQETVGLWGGEAAKQLGLEGEVTREGYHALVHNRHPETGEQLTGRTADNRTVGYDFNFHAPKGVSTMYALTKDERILTAFRDSVSATMQDIEQEMRARVRKDGLDHDRLTGNMAWAEFLHHTTRPIDGEPDPHLHAHCFVFNATHDHAERQWKAGQFRDIKQDAPYWQACFHVRFAKSLAEMGYGVARTPKGWDLENVPASVVHEFSRRTAEIEKLAAERGVTSPEVKARLGATTRESKASAKHFSMSQLRERWDQRLNDADRETLFRLAQAASPELFTARTPAQEREAVRAASARAMDFAVDHGFERASVKPSRRLLAEAMEHGVGQVTVSSVAGELERDGFIRKTFKGREHVTTRKVRDEEVAMIRWVRDGRGAAEPLGAGVNGRAGKPYAASPDLSDEQAEAVQHILSSADRVISVRGGAGTGKTTLLREAVQGILEGGRHVMAFAPSADASRSTLRGVGFKKAETVAKLLNDPALQAKLKGQVMWIDEAGQLGAPTMGRLSRLADRLGCRVLLTGDTRQHHAVERGDALRILEARAGIRSAEVRTIRRQKGAYREATTAIAQGRVREGLDTLQRMEVVREIWDDEARYTQLAADYAATVTDPRQALIVSPTHAEGAAVNTRVREALRAAGKLEEVDTPVSRLIDLQLTEAQRRDPLSYEPGRLVELHQNVPGFKKSERLTVVSSDKSGKPAPDGYVLARAADGAIKPLPLAHAARFNVFGVSEVGLSAGDVVRITKGGRSKDGKRLENGTRYQVKAFTKDGNVVLNNGWVVDRDYGHLNHGYVTTSHSAQSKTVRHVFLAQSSASAGAASYQQFNVSITRGQEGILIYTDSVWALAEAIERSDERMAAVELSDLPSYRVAQRAREVARLGLHASKAIQNQQVAIGAEPDSPTPTPPPEPRPQQPDRRGDDHGGMQREP